MGRVHHANSDSNTGYPGKYTVSDCGIVCNLDRRGLGSPPRSIAVEDAKGVTCGKCLRVMNRGQDPSDTHDRETESP